MQQTALGWLVLGLTNSPGLLGVTSAVANAPILLLSLWAGVLADRVDRRRLLVGVELVGAALATCLAVLTVTGAVVFWQVLVLAAIGGCAQAIGMPAFQAIVSSLVDRSVIGNAVALNSAQFNVSRIIGPAIAGAAIALGGIALAFWANAVILLIVAVIVASIRIGRPSAITQAEASMWGNLLDGLRYVRGNRTIALLLLLAAVPALFILSYIVLLPVYARDILGIGATGLGMLSAAIGVGALTGALGLAVLRPSGAGGRLLLVGLASAAVALIVFAVSTTVVVSLVALAVLGASQVAYYATTNTLIQVLVPARLRGRVLSLYILLALGLLPLGNLAAGIVAERFGAPVALAGGGVITLVVLAAVALRFPELRALHATAVISAPALVAPAVPVSVAAAPAVAALPVTAPAVAELPVTAATSVATPRSDSLG
jgi:MFS family permease